MNQIQKATCNAVLGNALEMYDFAVYGLYAHILAQKFFPSESEFTSLMLSLGVFATGFFMRPLGGLIIGQYGDTHGRRKALILSMLLMSAATATIGLTPTFESIGIIAPGIIVLCRLLQGFSAGAEYSGASVFMVEYYQSRGQQGFSGGLLAASGAVGSLAAVGLTMGLSYVAPDLEWAWRLPFLFGGALALAALYMRRHIDESPEYQKESASSRHPLRTIFSHYRYAFSKTVLVGMIQGAFAYMLFVYSKLYLLQHTNFSATDISLLQVAALLSYFVATPLWGTLSDKV